MTTLLLTGAGGFLGSHILEAALKRTNDLKIICVDSFRHNGGTDRILEAMVDTPDGGILDDTRHRVRVLTHDLTAPISSRQLADLGEVDYVVHAAARCSVDDSISDPAGHIANNMQTTLTMLELARVLRPSRYLHVSTDEVYGATGKLGESVVDHKPSSPYAASKAACEDICRAYRTTFNLPVAIMNSANLFGERQSSLAFIPRVIGMITAGETVPIHARDGFIGSRWYSYVRNVSEHVVHLLASDNGWKWRYALRGQEEWNTLDLAHGVAKLLDEKLKYEIVEAHTVRPGWDQRYLEMPYDPTWQPQVSADVGLKRTVEWAVTHPQWLES